MAKHATWNDKILWAPDNAYIGQQLVINGGEINAITQYDGITVPDYDPIYMFGNYYTSSIEADNNELLQELEDKIYELEMQLEEESQFYEIERATNKLLLAQLLELKGKSENNTKIEAPTIKRILT